MTDDARSKNPKFIADNKKKSAEWASVYDCRGVYATTIASLRPHNLQFQIEDFRAVGWAARIVPFFFLNTTTHCL